jgi:DNA mismatch repair ATPase MutS
MLVQQHKRFVALCEEFPRPQYEGPGLERRVVRVLTPGTLLDEPFLNTYENNYLLALSSVPATAPATETTIGLAWIDVSTGEFFAKTTTETGLHDEIVRLGPREIVLDKGLEDEPSHPIRRALQEEGCFVSYIEQPDIPVAHEGSSNLSAPISASDDITGVDTPTLTGESNAETQSVRLLTSYLHTTMLEHMPRLSAPRREQDSGRMHIDAHTLTALEIRESMREGGGVAGSLLAVVKRTVTNGGTRLLARWLCASHLLLFSLLESILLIM